jgi:hypothetical protein
VARSSHLHKAILEESVDPLSQLPGRVSAIEGQLIRLRDDVQSLRGDVVSLRGEFTAFQAEVRSDFLAVRDEFVAVRVEIREGDQETRRQMRVLHEDVISRIALLQVGIDRWNGHRRPASPKGRRSKRR